MSVKFGDGLGSAGVAVPGLCNGFQNFQILGLVLLELCTLLHGTERTFCSRGHAPALAHGRVIFAETTASYVGVAYQYSYAISKEIS